MQQGDAPYFKNLADKYAMSDNFHQSVNGGTGANHIMFGHGDMIWFSDAQGQAGDAAEHRGGLRGTVRTPASSTKSKIRIPQPGTNNWYTRTATATASMRLSAALSTNPVSGGGSYSDCADPTQPGVKPIVNYLKSLPRPIKPNCEAGHYYLLNNYNPGYFGNGKNAYTDTNPANTAFTIPPSSTPSIGDTLNAKNISWKYYGDQWNNYVNDPYQLNYGTPGPTADEYCNICNPFQYDTSIMSHPEQVTAHIQDTVEPLRGHRQQARCRRSRSSSRAATSTAIPASSKLDLFEGFVKKIVDQVQAIALREGHRHLHHLRRRRRLLRLRLRAAARLLRRRHPHPADRGVAASPSPATSRTTTPTTSRSSSSSSATGTCRRSPTAAATTSRTRSPNPSNPYVPVNTPAISDLFDFFNPAGTDDA